jgi:hypothetical protein
LPEWDLDQLEFVILSESLGVVVITFVDPRRQFGAGSDKAEIQAALSLFLSRNREREQIFGNRFFVGAAVSRE